MATKVQKWGNSLAVRLPRDAASKFNLREGTTVVIQPGDAGLLIKPLLKQKRKSLRELIAAITPENTHEAVDWGKPRGKEIW
ncbi:MAG: AbrB/MazE/SpoVT family DNA-binding domain-containing protein [Patescibacteria group bacterium]